jgi:hypothetical protein
MEDKTINIKDNEIEQEENGPIAIQIPFDPNKIKVSSQPHTIGEILDRIRYDEIKLDTEFQREFVWDKNKQSQFIESLLLKLPIPTFYFDGQDDNLWLVIDGLQRISTLKSFIIDKNLVLQGLELLVQYEGLGFDDLHRDLQRRITTFPITIYVVEKGTPDVVKYHIFSRINRGGLVLKPQEIRHALHQGVAANLLKELVSKDTDMGKSFVRATENKIQTKRMQDRDFVTRFIAFYLIDYQEYTPDLDSFLSKGLSQIKKLFQEKIIQLKEDFTKAMNTSWEVFGEDAFRKRFSLEDNRKPINKALFEVLTVNFAQLTEEQTKLLIAHKDAFKEKLMNLYSKDGGKFLRAISQGTAQKENVEIRFKGVEQIIQETLTNDTGNHIKEL